MENPCGLRAEVSKLKDINELLLRRRLFRSITRAERSEMIAFIDGIGIVTVPISFARRYIGNARRIPYFERVIEIPNAVVFTQERCAILYWFSTSKKFSRTEAWPSDTPRSQDRVSGSTETPANNKKQKRRLGTKPRTVQTITDRFLSNLRRLTILLSLNLIGVADDPPTDHTAELFHFDM